MQMQDNYNSGDYIDDGSPQFPDQETQDDAFGDLSEIADREIVEEQAPEQPYEDGQYQEEEPEPEERQQSPKKKTRIGERLSQVQRERYEALEEANRLRSENERLRSLANMSTQTALEHYDKSLVQKINAAKEEKIKALENGDIHAQTEADVALALATSEYHNLANMKAQHNYQRPQEQPQYQNQPQYAPQPQYQPPQPQLNEMVVQDWVATNGWFNPNSEDYDDELASQAEHYCTALDNNLYRTGRSHEIMSPQYFEAVNQYMGQVMAQRPRQRGGDLNMRPSRTTVSPVRGSGVQGSSQGQSKITLTADEFQMAKAYDIKPEVYLQYKIRDMREGKHERGRR